MIIITSMHSQRATKLHQWNLNHPPLRRPGVPGHTPVGSTSVIVTSGRSQRHRFPSNGTRNSVLTGTRSHSVFRHPESSSSQPPGPPKRSSSASQLARIRRVRWPQEPRFAVQMSLPQVTLRDCPTSVCLSLSELLSRGSAKHNGTPLSALVRACRKLHRGSRALHKGIVRPASQPSVYTRAVTPLSLTRRTPSRGRSACFISSARTAAAQPLRPFTNITVVPSPFSVPRGPSTWAHQRPELPTALPSSWQATSGFSKIDIYNEEFQLFYSKDCRGNPTGCAPPLACRSSIRTAPSCRRTARHQCRFKPSFNSSLFPLSNATSFASFGGVSTEFASENCSMHAVFFVSSL
jgi:hypothetical protein